jgi:hypothetical protein
MNSLTNLSLLSGPKPLAERCAAGRQLPAAAAAAGHQPNQIPVQTQADHLFALSQRKQAGRVHLDEGAAGQGQGHREEDPEGGTAAPARRGSDRPPPQIFPRAHTGMREFSQSVGML